tara:strand:- start:4254 stop:5348 length:1095 start_codon:yes stop_codon:yes gene_type:complete
MIVASSSVLLIVLSAFDGLKDFGLGYTSSFDPEIKVVPVSGISLIIDDETIKEINNLDFIESASPIIEEKVVLSNELNSGGVILKGVLPNYYLYETLDSISLIGAFSPSKLNTLFLGAELASSLDVVMSDDFSLTATAVKKNLSSIFNFSPFNSLKLNIEGVYQISSDIETKYAFAPLKTVSLLNGFGKDTYNAIEIVLSSSVSKDYLNKEISLVLGKEIYVMGKEELNPALYKMLNTENIAVYLIFTLVAIISMFNLIGSLTIMMVEKRKDLKIIEALGGKSGDFNKIFFYLGVFTTIIGTVVGIMLAFFVVFAQNNLSLVYVPGTSIPYPIKLSLVNVLVVFTTIFILGIITSAWSTSKLND